MIPKNTTTTLKHKNPSPPGSTKSAAGHQTMQLLFEVLVNTEKNVYKSLYKKHPHNAQLLDIFIPLLNARDALVHSLPPFNLPGPKQDNFSLGKPVLLPVSQKKMAYCDVAFLDQAPQILSPAIQLAFPHLSEKTALLQQRLLDQKELCPALMLAHVEGLEEEITLLAQRYETDSELLFLFAAQLARAAAHRVATAAAALDLKSWSKGYCPVCGKLPHASYLKNDGERWLQCSLCTFEWKFFRTQCFVCNESLVEKQEVYFIEANPEERAECCSSCKHYILSIDFRKVDRSIPLELLVLCMAHLDILVQEKGYKPSAAALTAYYHA